MDEKIIRNSEELDLDIQRFVNALLKNTWKILFVAAFCAALTCMGTFFFVTPQYQSSVMFHVNNNAVPAGDASRSISSADLSASRELVSSCIVILNTRESLYAVIDHTGVDLTDRQLKEMISAEAVDSTELFQVVVTSPDPREAETIAKAVGHILPKRISGIFAGASVRVADAAVVASEPSLPNYVHNTLLGLAAGLALAAAWTVLRELTDVRIRTEEDIVQSCAKPVLAVIPDMGASLMDSQSGYRQKRIHCRTGRGAEKENLVGGNICFAAAEAYKFLRTKLRLLFAGEGICRVIGISSASAQEGKSLTAVNLAYSMAQLGKRVLLMECDLRRPALAEMLPIEKTPGLSDFLSAETPAGKMLQPCGIRHEEQAFHIISAGRIPPNPMELLSSFRMEKLIDRLRANYDYIIFDLPTMGEVSDALAVSKLTDGMLLVVRRDYCDRMALNAATRQLAYVDDKFLGIVFNCATEAGSGWNRTGSRKSLRLHSCRKTTETIC